MNKKEIEDKLLRIDEDVTFRLDSDLPNKAEVILVGGGALLLCDLSAKETTKDVDVYQMNAERAVREILYSDPDINGMCQAFSQNMPYNFEDRLVKLELPTYSIDYFIPSQEDLAVMKLYRWEAPDIADLTSDIFLHSLDWAMLEHLVFDPNEAEASRSSTPNIDLELKQMRFNFKIYKEGWCR